MLFNLQLYKKDVEKLVEAVIVPRITNQVRFLRARACWAVKVCLFLSYFISCYLNLIVTVNDVHLNNTILYISRRTLKAGWGISEVAC